MLARTLGVAAVFALCPAVASAGFTILGSNDRSSNAVTVPAAGLPGYNNYFTIFVPMTFTPFTDPTPPPGYHDGVAKYTAELKYGPGFSESLALKSGLLYVIAPTPGNLHLLSYPQGYTFDASESFQVYVSSQQINALLPGVAGTQVQVDAQIGEFQVFSEPEPGALTVLASGVPVLAWIRRRNRRQGGK